MRVAQRCFFWLWWFIFPLDRESVGKCHTKHVTFLDDPFSVNQLISQTEYWETRWIIEPCVQCIIVSGSLPWKPCDGDVWCIVGILFWTCSKLNVRKVSSLHFSPPGEWHPKINSTLLQIFEWTCFTASKTAIKRSPTRWQSDLRLQVLMGRMPAET